MSQLQHQGIVRVIEPICEDGGYHFFVMEYVDGGDLHQAVLEGRLKGISGLQTLRSVAEALDFAHRQGIVHRDVKPSNVLLGSDGRAKLTDFDLVRAFDTTGGTRTGRMLGTFLYSAPEALAESKTVGAKADLYSLAMTMVFVLSGEELPHTVLRDSEQFIAGLECGYELRQVLLTATLWEPEQRPASVLDLWQAVQEEKLPASNTLQGVQAGPEAPRSDLMMEQAIKRAASDWDRLGRDAGALFAGKQLERALAWAAEQEFVPNLMAQFLAEAQTTAEEQEKLLAAAHKSAVQQEKERLSSLGMLAAGLAHEVNTPLTGISSYAQLLLTDVDENDPRHAILRKMERQTFRAAQIINNLLEFSRSRSDDSEPVPIDAVIEESSDLLTDRAEENGVEIEWQRPDTPLLVLGNEGELHQVFTNLMVNAIEAMGSSGGRLTLAAETSDAWIQVTVSDNGPGISEDQLNSIFQPFFSSKKTGSGSGLGLAITANIVKRHSGKIRVENHQNRNGCCVTVEFPAASENALGDGPEGIP